MAHKGCLKRALEAARHNPSARSGVCQICGCTEDQACALEVDGEIFGCWWVDKARTLCSNPDCLAKMAGGVANVG